jgi:hypothetical protein
MRRCIRRGVAVSLVHVVALVVGLGACASAGPVTSGSDPVELAQVAAGGSETGPSALDDPRDPRLPAPLIKPDELVRAVRHRTASRPSRTHASSMPTASTGSPRPSRCWALTVAGETRAFPIQRPPNYPTVSTSSQATPSSYQSRTDQSTA